MASTSCNTPICVCGRELKSTIFKPNSKFHRKWCDGCHEQIAEDKEVYSCDTVSRSVTAHPNGYDLCTECAAKNSKPPSNAATVALTQMGFTISDSMDAIKAANDDLTEALKILLKKSIPDNEEKSDHIQKLYEQERNINVVLKQTIQQYESELKLLRSELHAAKSGSNKLLDDKKEMEIIINKLKKENNELKKKNINEREFFKWDYEQILCWILSIDDGYYEKYYDNLRIELQDCELSGTDLSELNTKDIRGLGVKKFSDAKKLEKYIEELVAQYGGKSQSLDALQVIADTENEGAITYYK